MVVTFKLSHPPLPVTAPNLASRHDDGSRLPRRYCVGFKAIGIGASIASTKGHHQRIERDQQIDAGITPVVATLGATGQKDQRSAINKGSCRRGWMAERLKYKATPISLLSQNYPSPIRSGLAGPLPFIDNSPCAPCSPPCFA